MVWETYLSILISIGGITEQRRLHLNRSAPVITGLYVAAAAAEGSPSGTTFAALQRCVCLEGSSGNNVALDLCEPVCLCV